MRGHWILAAIIIALIGVLAAAPLDFRSATITGFAARQGIVGVNAASAIGIALVACIIFVLVFQRINKQRPV